MYGHCDSYLPSRRASPPPGRYQIIQLIDRTTWQSNIKLLLDKKEHTTIWLNFLTDLINININTCSLSALAICAIISSNQSDMKSVNTHHTFLPGVWSIYCWSSVSAWSLTVLCLPSSHWTTTHTCCLNWTQMMARKTKNVAYVKTGFVSDGWLASLSRGLGLHMAYGG